MDGFGTNSNVIGRLQLNKTDVLDKNLRALDVLTDK
jgi:hypothetical protein